MVLLSSQEMQDSFDTILFGEDFVVHLHLLLLLIELVIVHSLLTVEVPKLIFVLLFALEIGTIGLNQLRFFVVARYVWIVGAFWPLLLKQVSHLMQNTEAYVVVGFDLHVALLDRTSERLKVHTHLRHFDLDRSYPESEVTSVFLLSIQNTFEYFALILELVLGLDLLRDVLQEIENRQGKSELLFLFVDFLYDSLLVLDHNVDGHADSRETELGLE